MPSGQKKTITETTKSDNAPWAPAQPYFLDLYKNAQDAFGATTKNPFTGDFLAQTGQDFAAGTGMMRDALTAGAPTTAAGAGAVNQLGLATARGDFLRPDSNPFLAAMGEAATRPLYDQFTNVINPAITDQAIAQGAYGGSGQDISQERAAAGTARAAGDTLAGLYGNAYAQERQLQQNAPALLSAGHELGLMPGRGMIALDEMIRQSNQLGLDNQRQRFMEEKQAPWYGLGELSQILTAGGFRTTNTTATKDNPNYVDPFTNALKIGLGGASTIASLGGMGGFGLWGPQQVRAA
jgi:hypothetical protein